MLSISLITRLSLTTLRSKSNSNTTLSTILSLPILYYMNEKENVFAVPCFLTKLAARLIYNFAIDIVFPSQEISLK